LYNFIKSLDEKKPLDIKTLIVLRKIC